MGLKRFLWSAVALCAAIALPVPAPAVTHITMSRPIKVNTCNPQRNVYMNTGFTPAYYPIGIGPYWGWPSVYGPMYYSYPVQGHPTLSIDYVNASNVVMKQIEFGLIVHGNLVAEVKDVGTFSPGVEIKHEFGLNPNVFPIRSSLSQCIPLKITFADGAKWKNPHLPALRRSIYGRPPR